jgi:NADH:ubiquinone oxidoreductase subunit 4 (subunit M)
VLLAGIILKLGVFALVRFLIPISLDACFFFYPYAQCLGLFSIFFTSLLILRQIDLKKIIAYSSIIHMNYITCCLFTISSYSVLGTCCFLLSHGLISSGLFILIGYIYERYGTRNIKFLINLNLFMPIFSFFFIIFNLANMSFPGFISFIGEFLIILGLSVNNLILTFSVLFFIIFTSIFSF